MPPFNAFAGRSPNCCVVRVQMEHCALPETIPATDSSITSKKYPANFFIPADWISKIRNLALAKAAYPASSAFIDRADLLRSSSFRITLRNRIFLGVTSIHSSC